VAAAAATEVVAAAAEAAIAGHAAINRRPVKKGSKANRRAAIRALVSDHLHADSALMGE
jgi:hypothetical protein